jgi:hypothetical protein
VRLDVDPRYAGQPSPDKSVNCPCTSSPFTLLPLWERLRDQPAVGAPWPTRLGNPARPTLRVGALAFLSVASQVLAPAFFPRFVASPQLPSPRTLSIGVIHLA